MKKQKIVSAKKIGILPVMDLNMPDEHNFVLANGTVVHNCAYSETGYITMYLKTHYPIEWWSAVLNNERDEDAIRRFSSILRDTLKPPTIKSLYSKFTPIKDKIYAPVWSIKGVGQSVAQALINKGPYKNVAELAAMTAGTAFRVNTFVPMMNAGCFDSFLDNTKPYVEARKQVIDTFARIRKSEAKGVTDPLFTSPLPIQRFILAKNAYTLFNKRVIEDPELAMIFETNALGDLTKTPSKIMPYYYQKTKNNTINIITGLEELKSVPIIDKDPQLYGILCLFKGSEHKTGISKKSGRKWEHVKISVDDGCTAFDIPWWDKKNALRYPIDSLILIIGRAKIDWRGTTTLDIHSVESINV